MSRNFPILTIIILAAAQLGAFVYFTKQDSPWRLVGVGIAILLMLVCVLGYKFFKAEK
jgi:hypothetical protein